MYTITVTDLVTQKIFYYNVNIKHLRSFDGPTFATHGGFTVLANIANGKLYYSRCNPIDQFSRHIGILTAVQQMIGNKLIEDFKFSNRGLSISLNSDYQAIDWWVKKVKFENVWE